MKRALGLVLLVACGGPSTEAECIANYGLAPEAGAAVDPGTEAAPAAAEVELSAFEQELLSPALEDVRVGVRPFADETVGICQGSGKECEAYLGTDPGELGAGEYMLRGEFRVPKIGAKGTWKVTLDTECVTTRVTEGGESSSTDARNREYDVVYTGETRGYRLSPMVRIESPAKRGSVACTYVITSHHPDGATTIEGGWKVPAAEAE